jgi:hypothetical protein
MTTTDWLINIALVLVVFRQIRESRLGARFILLPIVLVGISVASYLHSIPTAGNDLALVLVLTAAGAILGVAGGLLTRVRGEDGRVFVKAGVWAAILWVVGMGARIGFELYSEHGGAGAIARFSMHHDITSAAAWTAAFVLMAIVEVGARMGTILIRAALVHRAQAAAPAEALIAA